MVAPMRLLRESRRSQSRPSTSAGINPRRILFYMSVEYKSCGCYVARWEGRETHGETWADAIERMLAIITGQAIDPLSIPL